MRYEPTNGEQAWRLALGRSGALEEVLAQSRPTRERRRPTVRVEGVGTVTPDGVATRLTASTTPAKPSKRHPSPRPRTLALDILERTELDAYRAGDPSWSKQ